MMINNNFKLTPMNINPKARRRISFTPIMLSTAVSTQPPSRSSQWTAQTMSSCVINGNSPESRRKETIYPTIYSETPQTTPIARPMRLSSTGNSLKIASGVLWAKMMMAR